MYYVKLHNFLHISFFQELLSHAAFYIQYSASN